MSSTTTTLSRIKHSLFTIGVLLTFATGCSKTAIQSSGPTETQIANDWEAFVSGYDRDKPERPWVTDVKFKTVKVSGTSINNNTAEVLVMLTGEWVGGIYPGTGGWKDHNPTGGFRPVANIDQTVSRKFTYKKYDTGWILERIELIGTN